MIELWSKETSPDDILTASHVLGLSVASLRSIGICWAKEHKAWAFPMKDGYNNMVGIRLRRPSGAKFAVTGSHQGCFIPMQVPKSMVLVCEGPTDTCAALDMGFYSVGRPSCSGGTDILRHFFRRVGIRKAAVIADNDDPGIMGARMLSAQLGIPSCVVVLPCKDFREFIQLGGNAELTNEYLNTAIWRQSE